MLEMIDYTTALLTGPIDRAANTELRHWLKSLREDKDSGVLLLDTEGGVCDPTLLQELVITPVHVHVLRDAQSWGMCLAMCASSLTANPGSTFTIHAPRYDLDTDSDDRTEEMDDLEYNLAAILSSVVPAGTFREVFVDALHNRATTFFDPDFLEQELVIDRVAPIDLSLLPDQKKAKSIERKYNERR